MDAVARPRHRRQAVRTALAIRQGCHPPQRALAHRQQGILGQLFADPGFERHHHAQRPVLRALPRGPSGGGPGAAPPDDPRPGGAADRPHHARHRALSIRFPHPLPRMSGQRRHGVARGAAQFAAVHPRHGELRRMDRRETVDAAGRGRHQERSQVGAGRRRRRRAHDAQPAAREMSRRRAGRLRAERRGAAARAGLPAAAIRAGLGRQCLGQMAAPHQARRSALVHA